MTVKELDNSFKQYLDKVDSQAIPDLIPEERQRFLNDAALWLAAYLTEEKTASQDAVDLRQHLGVRPHLLPVTLREDQEVYETPLPSDYLHFSSLRVQVSNSFVRPTLVSAVVVDENKLSKLLEDPFNRSSIYAPVVSVFGGYLNVYRDTSYQVGGLQLAYYRYPKAISFASPSAVVDFPERLLPTLIQKAVSLALDPLEIPRQQTQLPNLTLATPNLS